MWGSDFLKYYEARSTRNPNKKERKGREVFFFGIKTHEIFALLIKKKIFGCNQNLRTYRSCLKK